jgi:predicted enzyme related to lactoylglutathione lyase
MLEQWASRDYLVKQSFEHWSYTMTNEIPTAQLGLVLDCADPERLAGFWSEALGYTNLGTFGVYSVLRPRDGRGPNLLLQRVSEPKVAKNRMHFDIHIADIEREVARLEQLGANRVDSDPRCEHGTAWIQMRDPEGNEFCVCDGGASSHE